MWPQKNLKILVPRTPPDPPLPPLTPPRGPGGPKMAKMHSLKSIDDNLCQKSHFWGVKKIDLFFHSEYTSCLGDYIGTEEELLHRNVVMRGQSVCSRLQLVEDDPLGLRAMNRV